MTRNTLTRHGRSPFDSVWTISNQTKLQVRNLGSASQIEHGIPVSLIEDFTAPGTYDPKHVDTSFKASLIPRRDDFKADQNPGKTREEKSNPKNGWAFTMNVNITVL